MVFLISFVCAYDLSSKKSETKIAQLLSNARNSLYLTATQSIKKLRLESDILSSLLFEKDNSDFVSMFSITEFLQEITRESYVSNDILSLADCRYILCKVIEYMFKEEPVKYNMFYSMRYDVFELFRSLIFHNKRISETGMIEICHNFSCFEQDLFSLYELYVEVLENLLDSVSNNSESELLSEMFGNDFINKKSIPGIKLFSEKQKTLIANRLDNIDTLFMDGFLFLNDMQRYIVKTAHQKNISIYFIIKSFDAETSNFIIEDNYKKLANELGEDIELPTLTLSESNCETQLDSFRAIYPFTQAPKLDKVNDGSIRLLPPFVNRETELRFVVEDISNRLKEQYNGNVSDIISAVNKDFAIITGIEKEKYQDRLENLFREVGVFIFKGKDNLEKAGYDNVNSDAIKKLYFARKDFLSCDLNDLSYNDKCDIFDKCFTRIKINKTIRPIATYPVGQFIIEIYRIISQGMSVEGFKTILYSNWKHTFNSDEPMWSKYISDFKYVELFLENKKTISEWIDELTELYSVKERIQDNPLYKYHPINCISSESLSFFRSMMETISVLCNELSSVSGGIEQHLEALKALISRADTLLDTNDDDLEYEQLIVKRIVNAIKDIGSNSLMNDISSTYFAENIRYMLVEWEKQNDEEEDSELRLNVVNLENMQKFKHTYFILAEAEKYPRHYKDKFPYSKDILAILTEDKYEIKLNTGEVRGLDYHLKLERYLFKNVLDFTTSSLTITRSEKEGSHHTSDTIYVKDMLAVFGDTLWNNTNTTDKMDNLTLFDNKNEKIILPKQNEYKLVELGLFKLCPKLYYHTHIDNNQGSYLNDLQLKFYCEAVLFCDIFRRFTDYNLQNKMVYLKAATEYRPILIELAQESYAEHFRNFSFLNEYEIKDIKRNVLYKVLNFIENGKQYIKGYEITLIPYSNKKYMGDGYELVIEHDNRYVDYTNKTYRISQNGIYLEFLVLKSSTGKSKLIHYKDMIAALDNNDENEDRINLISRIISKINIQFDSKKYANDGIVRTNELVKQINTYDFSKAKAMSSNYCNYCRFRDICMQK